MNYSALSHNLVSNGWNLIKHILSTYDYGVMVYVKFCDVLNIYDHSVVMHLKFRQDVFSNGGVIAI